ncbi:UNVERIFIED_CONTAM: hypothetical protein FKN15_004706 [Acipenser sinensis]
MQRGKQLAEISSTTSSSLALHNRENNTLAKCADPGLTSYSKKRCSEKAPSENNKNTTTHTVQVPPFSQAVTPQNMCCGFMTCFQSTSFLPLTQRGKQLAEISSTTSSSLAALHNRENNTLAKCDDPGLTSYSKKRCSEKAPTENNKNNPPPTGLKLVVPVTKVPKLFLTTQKQKPLL